MMDGDFCGNLYCCITFVARDHVFSSGSIQGGKPGMLEPTFDVFVSG